MLDIPERESRELIMRHSPAFRKRVISFILKTVMVGESFTKDNISKGIKKKFNLDIHKYPWWRQGRLLSKSPYFEKEGHRWKRVR